MHLRERERERERRNYELELELACLPVQYVHRRKNPLNPHPPNLFLSSSPPPPPQPPTPLSHTNTITIHRQNRLTPRKRLRPRPNALQIQIRTDPVILHQIVEKINQIPAVARHILARRDEAIHGRRAVGAAVHVEGHAPDRGRGGGLPCRGDGARAAERAKPDHDLVLGVAGGGAAEEHIVADVGDEGAAAVGPRPGGRDRAYGGEFLDGALVRRGVLVSGGGGGGGRELGPRGLTRDLEEDFTHLVEDDVGVGLDRVLPAGPGPGGRPADGGVLVGLDGGALRAGGGGGLAPEVRVEEVGARGLGLVLAALRGLAAARGDVDGCGGGDGGGGRDDGFNARDEGGFGWGGRGGLDPGGGGGGAGRCDWGGRGR